MKTRNGMRIISVLMTLLLVSAMAMPAMACEPATTCGNESIVGKSVQLTGEERDNTLDMALKNSQVKKLQKQLIADGFTQKEIKAYVVPVQSEDGSVVEIQVAAIGFESSNAEVAKQMLMFAYNPETGGTVVVQGTGWDCVYCAAALAGCTACAYACGGITPACVLCLAAGCLSALGLCTACCCSLGNEWCCDRVEW